MQYYPFDSRNLTYRSKIGALAEGETLRLRLLLHNDAKVHSAFLKMRKDDSQNGYEVEMNYAENIEEYLVYECEISLEEGLYWYSFRYNSDYGEFFVTKTESSLGVVSGDGGNWQQTVYGKNYKTPSWLEGGIIYQIFPDRFYNSKTKKKNVPSDRFITENWEKQPEYRQPKDEKLCLGNDYYGGDLKGIEKKLDYIASLGVNCIYLNPIFEAHSNHRYNTADYFKIDSLLGDEKDLCSLVKAAKKRGIYIILDGVFSHTGDDSVYFNGCGRYSSVGAAQSKDSPYYKWYTFEEYPEKYEAWWGIKTLPETNENSPDFCEFVTGEEGVLRYWLKKGIKGWRLDVADELPDEFLDKVRIAVKSEGEENFILGEVWEDATNKISYGARRRFLRGNQLDSVMNYPFSNAIVDFIKYGNGNALINNILNVTENYPPQAVNLLMNHIGTHDTARILTRLGTNETFEGDRETQSQFSLSEAEFERAVKKLKLAAVLQYTLPGVPSLYYGDEVGVQGFGDPFCRSAYPWGKENTEILEFYKNLGKLRRNNNVFASGEFIPISSDEDFAAYFRKYKNKTVMVAINRGENEREINLPVNFKCKNSLFGENLENKKVISAESFAIIELE